MFRRETFIALRARRQALSVARAVMYGPRLKVEPPAAPKTVTPVPPPPRDFDDEDPSVRPTPMERRLDQAALVYAAILAIGGCALLALAAWKG
jgi:hypothetical protein